jgi:DNA-binding NarL/FixJ family response regulator
MDFVTAQDMEHRTAMERGSQELLEAIRWARKGFNPGTSEKPVKLPPDWSDRCAPDYASMRGNRPEKRPSNERIREMMERGLSPKEIASELKTSHQKIVAISKTIKLERRRDDFEERIHQQLWG